MSPTRPVPATRAAPRPLEPLGPLGAIDRAFADLVARLGGDDLVAASAALVSRERGRGHSCLDLAAWAGRRWAGGDSGGNSTADATRAPRLEAWHERLAASKLVAVEPSEGEPVRPLVLDAANRLYLWRYWRAERRLARRVHRLLVGAPGEAEPSDEIETLFARLFPDFENDESADPGTRDQARAARAALRRPLTLVSGGPGTGKTTTVTRILALLHAARPGLRSALAAPTGKAAARLEESLTRQVAGLREILGDEPLLDRLPRSASTLHRLLGYRPRDDRFRHRAENPLSLDLLVIDEASMVDLLLVDASLDALPESARVILLGDRDQLASVDAGFVFGDLCRAAGVGAEAPVHPALDGVAVELRTSFRFRHRPGIGALAEAIRVRDPRRVVQVLDDPRFDEVRGAGHPDEEPVRVLEPVLDAIDAYLDAAGPLEALERLERFRVLAATRVGPWGTERLCRLVERHLETRGRPTAEAFYPGRPVLVEANDYQVRLFNGDLGVVWPDEGPDADGGLWAFFPGERPGTLRRLPLAKLPPHATAWAMTVHKSQGSEFDHVLLVLPESPDVGGDLVSRELLYTGVTRGRERVDVVAPTAVLEAAVRRSARRASGLVDVLALGLSDL